MGTIRDCGLITIRQKMSLDGPAGRSESSAGAEPAVKSPLRMVRQPLCEQLPVETWLRSGGTSTSAGERCW